MRSMFDRFIVDFVTSNEVHVDVRIVVIVIIVTISSVDIRPS